MFQQSIIKMSDSTHLTRKRNGDKKLTRNKQIGQKVNVKNVFDKITKHERANFETRLSVVGGTMGLFSGFSL